MTNSRHKFRAYDSEEKEWYYSDIEYGHHFFEFKDGMLKCFGIGTARGSMNEPPELESYECEDVKEYIDQKDKNGVKIYEGDIIRGTWGNGDTAVRIITHNNVYCGFAGLDINEKNSIFYPTNCEIIGNKTENPELLDT